MNIREKVNRAIEPFYVLSVFLVPPFIAKRPICHVRRRRRAILGVIRLGQVRPAVTS